MIALDLYQVFLCAFSEKIWFYIEFSSTYTMHNFIIESKSSVVLHNSAQIHAR